MVDVYSRNTVGWGMTNSMSRKMLDFMSSTEFEEIARVA